MTNKIQKKVMKMKTDKNTWQDVGDKLGVSRSLAWRIAHGKCSGEKVKAAIQGPPPPVDRMAARLSVDDGKRARAMLAEGGYSSITDFWREFIKLVD